MSIGNDFFYSGVLEDEESQKKVVLFAQSYFEQAKFYTKAPIVLDLLIEINPHPDSLKLNIFGIIPDHGNDKFSSRKQFVFDRSSGGELVKLLRLPKISDLLVPHEDIIEPGGYSRQINDDMEFALFLYILKLRYFENLKVTDDYMIFKTVLKHVLEFGLNEIFTDKTVEFSKCKNIFFKQYRFHSIRPQNIAANPKEQLSYYFSKLIALPINPEKILLSDINFSVRAHNCLKKHAKINTLADLLLMSENDFKAVKNFGNKSLSEIEELLDFLQAKMLKPSLPKF